MRFKRLARKVIGLICIALVPLAIILPGVPGDWLLLTGLALLSDKLLNWFKVFYDRHGKLVKTYVVVSTVLVIGFWGFKLVKTICS